MYEIIHRDMPKTIGIRIGDDIQEADFVALRAEMAAILDDHAPLNVVFQCDEGVAIQPAVLWDDMNFVDSRAGQLGRMAMIASEDWGPMQEIMSEKGFVTRHFSHAEAEAAWRWANED